MYSSVCNIEFKLNYSLQNKRSASEIMFYARKLKRPKNEEEYLTILFNGA